MDETIIINSDRKDKTAVYSELIVQLDALLEGESDEIAGMANTVAAIKEVFDFFWVGFYRVLINELVLGPFQGPIACTRIAYGRGVCGSSWKENKTLLVPDVDLFPGHIACSSLSRSEIVVPLRSDSGEVRAVLDVDSSALNDFDERDQLGLEKICKLLGNRIYP